MAQGSRGYLSLDVETTWNTVPATPSMLTIPFNSHTLNMTKATLESAEIRSDRLVADHRHGNISAAGSVTVDMTTDDYDDFIESAMFSTFSSAGVINIGTTQKSLYLEDGQADISEYRRFSGMVVSSWTMNIAPNAMVTSTFNLVGGGMTTNASALAAPSAATGNLPWDSFNGSINEGGSGLTNCTALSFTLDNSVSPSHVIGNENPLQLDYGRGRITGSITVHYQDSTLIDRFINETVSNITVTLTDGVSGNGYLFNFPEVYYNGADTPLQSEQSRFVTLPFVAVRDSSLATSLRISKNQ